MPYDKLGDLPDAVKALPKHAQEIWLAAFNSAYEQYDGNEGKSHGTAWAAVKDKYKKQGDRWVEKADDGPPDGSFAFGVPVQRVWKANDDQGVPQLWFEGVASTQVVDKQDERASPDCIRKMREHPPLDLFDSHSDRRAGEELGVTKEHEVTSQGGFLVRGLFFDDNAQAVRVWKRMAEGKRYELSIGGKVKAAHWEVNKADGARVRVLDDIELDHIVVARSGRAVNPECWVTAIAKSLPDEPEEVDAMPQADEVSNETAKQDEVAPIPVEIVAVQPVTPATDFAGNVRQATAEERYWDLEGPLCDYTNALYDTVRGICGAPKEDRLALLSSALKDFTNAVLDSLGEEIAKAGRRNSAVDESRIQASMKTLQEALATLQELLTIPQEVGKSNEGAGGPGDTTGQAQAKEAMMADKEDVTKEASETPTDEAAQTAVPDEEELAKATTEEPKTPETVEKAQEAAPQEPAEDAAAATLESAIDVDAIIAKAVEAGRKAATEDAGETIAQLEKQVGEQGTALAKATVELEQLKSAPAGGGPEGKPSGDAAKVEKAEDGEGKDLLDTLLEKGDVNGAKTAAALNMLQGSRIRVTP